MKKRTKKLLLCLVLASPAWGDERATIPFAQLAKFNTAFNAIPAAQRDKLIFVLQIEHTDKTNHTPIHAWVDADGTHTVIPLDPDGTIHLPDKPDWATHDVMVQTDQPRHSLDTGIDLYVPPPPGRSIPVHYLRDAVQQGNAAMRAGARQLGGYVAMLMAPTAKQVDIAVADCCNATATVQGSAAPTILKQGPAGTIVIPLSTLRDNPDGTITLSAPATKIDLFPD